MTPNFRVHLVPKDLARLEGDIVGILLRVAELVAAHGPLNDRDLRATAGRGSQTSHHL